MTKIKWMEEHRLLQMTLWMIWPPLCSSVPLQMVICKEDGSLDDQNQGGGRAGIVANDHPEDLTSSVPLQMVICKERFALFTWSSIKDPRSSNILFLQN